MPHIFLTLYSVFLFSVSGATANPIATASVEKTWERCLVAVSDTHADVSCAVGYKTTDGSKNFLHFSVPIFLPSSAIKDKSDALRFAKPRLEVDGRIYEPSGVRIRDSEHLKNGITKVDFKFLLNPIYSSTFSIVVTYRQPLTSKNFYYLPQFESETQPKKSSKFMITIFPSGSGTIDLMSKNKTVPASMKSRITVTPLHNEMIVVHHTTKVGAAPNHLPVGESDE